MTNRKKNIGISFRVNNQEWELIHEKFKLSKIKNFRDFAVQALIFSHIYAIDTVDLSKLIYEINKIGTNVNQIAHRVNESGNLYSSDLEEIKNKIYLVSKTIESYLNFFENREECSEWLT